MRKKTRLIYGVGVNDADYIIHPLVDGKRVPCPFYSVWAGVLERCYSLKMQENNRTYIGCTVDAEWLVFSKFKEWMQLQDWKGNEIDKDLLVKGNKHYSPETCVFVSSTVNSFLTNCQARRGLYPIGVTWSKSKGKFVARCRNPILKRCESLGNYSNENDAANAWLKRKREMASQLAEMQTSKKVKDALMRFYD